MNISALRICLLGLAALFCVMTGAAAQTVNIGDRFCVLTDAGDLSAEDALARPELFDCSEDRLRVATEHFWLLGDVADIAAGIESSVLLLRMSRHLDISIYVTYTDGSFSFREYDTDALREMWQAPSSMQFPLTLGPSDTRIPERVMFGVTAPWDPVNWSAVAITSAQTAHAANHRAIGAVLFSVGLLSAPILFSFLFFGVLRYPFLLLNALTSLSTVMYVIFWSGIIFAILPQVTVTMRSVADHMTIVLSLALGCLMVRALCEPGTLGPRNRLALAVTAVFIMVSSAIIIGLSPRFAYIGSEVFHLLGLLPFIVVVIALVTAVRNGSKLAIFQMIAWTPISMFAIGRVLRGLGILDFTGILDYIFLPALVFEALVISLAVALRLLNMRNELEQLSAEREILLEYADTDPLTGLLNRRALAQAMKSRPKAPEGKPLYSAILVIDIDHFKAINDTFGHDVGDIALVQLAAILRAHCRSNDLCSRFGGEEFVMILSATNADGARLVADRIRTRVAEKTFGSDTRPIDQITVSIGISIMTTADDSRFDDHYRAADQALYSAKTSGRNKVCMALPITDPLADTRAETKRSA
ncbi:sensor domain-containing diguanylate cyclase [Henriciella litoralis]|uniref:sensor domain-containing diguanylate cyclase n=1 Tax=Henriciella litoralis TaxID=568102 RepID=UPI000A06BBF8|nr:diguanylate cyclase [Henriciella litoralis]